MSTTIKTLSGEVGIQATEGQLLKGVVIEITGGRADEFMDEAQCKARKTQPDTPYINIEFAIPGFGLRNKSFPNYANGDDPISPNTIHGKVLATYPNLKADSEINVIASKKEYAGGSSMVWNVVLV